MAYVPPHAREGYQPPPPASEYRSFPGLNRRPAYGLNRRPAYGLNRRPARPAYEAREPAVRAQEPDTNSILAVIINEPDSQYNNYILIIRERWITSRRLGDFDGFTNKTTQFFRQLPDGHFGAYESVDGQNHIFIRNNNVPANYNRKNAPHSGDYCIKVTNPHKIKLNVNPNSDGFGRIVFPWTKSGLPKGAIEDQDQAANSALRAAVREFNEELGQNIQTNTPGLNPLPHRFNVGPEKRYAGFKYMVNLATATDILNHFYAEGYTNYEAFLPMFVHMRAALNPGMAQLLGSINGHITPQEELMFTNNGYTGLNAPSRIFIEHLIDELEIGPMPVADRRIMPYVINPIVGPLPYIQCPAAGAEGGGAGAEGGGAGAQGGGSSAKLTRSGKRRRYNRKNTRRNRSKSRGRKSSRKNRRN